MIFSFHPDAETEFNHAIDFYENSEIGLGYDFAAEVYDSVQIILNHPEAWHPLGDGIRCCLIKRFPYGIIYAHGNNEILVLAVMHSHRQPDYWRERQ